VPQDVRERKGSFFTPQIWVELSQKYIADVLGEDWQDGYYAWDCAAGTGNLLNGLTNKYNIWTSTLDRQDVDVMRDRIKNGANLLDSHVFQFDFLNDDFSKLPQGLQDIINDEGKRKKLVIYINPPYAEGDNRMGTGRKDVQVSKIHDEYAKQLEDAKRELFAQFLIRIYSEIPDCKIGEFSKLKTLTGSHFSIFRENFKARLEKMFIVPAWTFDNVKGRFPIGFKFWDASIKEEFKEANADIFDEKGNKFGIRKFHSYSDSEYFSKWVNSFRTKKELYLGWLARVTLNDFQANNTINILNSKDQLALVRGAEIYDTNLAECCVCFAVRKVTPADWLNDRDQFLYPSISWKTDEELQSDCLAYALFSNNIQSKYGVNHWIPFTEYQVGARDKFASSFMTDFISGKTEPSVAAEPMLFYKSELGGGGGYTPQPQPRKFLFSAAARNVFSAGRQLWSYYHSQPSCNVNASLHDIREHFQGRNSKGKMNSKPDDERYGELMGSLRASLKALAKKIEPKVYEHGFLKK
jgi:hypothetical protein